MVQVGKPLAPTLRRSGPQLFPPAGAGNFTPTIYIEIYMSLLLPSREYVLCMANLS